MALEIKQHLKLTQQLVMTPQLQQAIKLLQLSRMELVELVREEMVENPVLEDGRDGNSEQEDKPKDETYGDDMSLQGLDTETPPPSEQKKGPEEQVSEVKADEGAVREIDWDSYLEDYSMAPPMPSSRVAPSEDLPSLESTLSRRPGLSDHLIWQLKMSDLGDFEESIGMHIIGNLNAAGYMSDVTVEEIAEAAEAPLDLVEAVLMRVQTFDPLGVAARDLAECLMIQAKYHGEDDKVITAILRDHMGNLERKNYPAIARAVGEPLEEIYEAVKVIASFDPKPGRLYTDEDPVYITPDVYIHKVGDRYFVVPNDDGLPKLKISNFYRSALSCGPQAREYIQDKLRSAQWLIRSIQQRQRTIVKVAESILKFQREFFDKGIAHLKPLILRDVAEDIGMHESTISRVTTNKYVHTPQGIFELKFFFNSGINRTDGDEIASESVKSKIKDIIGGEDPRKPLSDQKIVVMLKDQGIEIARRTVAKYREQMGILSSSKRKQLF